LAVTISTNGGIMIFISAQDYAIQYLWQVHLSVFNLTELGVPKENIHVLFALSNGQRNTREENELLQTIQQHASVFLYPDRRENTGYPSSIRPHILAQHIGKYTYLEKELLFYHDCDIYIRELPPILNSGETDSWYVSETANYLDSQYVILHIGQDNFTTMCDLVGVPPQKVVDQDQDCGGAQYLLRQVSAAFWQKVEKDSERIFEFLSRVVNEQRIQHEVDPSAPIPAKPIQTWCADMWALLWNAIYFNQPVKVHPDLAFCWPKQPIEAWDTHYLFHNAGISYDESDRYFFKGGYIFHPPFYESFERIDKKYCSYHYVEAIKRLSQSMQAHPLLDLSFLFLIAKDTPVRPDLLFASVGYLQKHFDTNILILEQGPRQLLHSDMFRKPVTLLYAPGSDGNPDKTHLSDLLAQALNTPYFVMCDAGMIVPVSQILESARSIRCGCSQKILPFDNEIVKVDEFSSAVFSQILADEFLEANKDKFSAVSDSNYEPYVFLNRQAYLETGGDLNMPAGGTERIDGSIYQISR